MTSASQTELLPCPFCGGAGRIVHDTSSDYPAHWTYRAMCINDDCAEGGHEKDEATAIAWWNRRYLIALARSANEPVASGYPCDGCSHQYDYDLIVPDELWAKISPKPIDGWKSGGLLCPQCIVDRMTRSAERPLEVGSAPVVWKPTHVHKKRGTTYRVIEGSARLQTSGRLDDNEVMVVYEAEDGSRWVRAEYEFNDGRFEMLAIPHTVAERREEPDKQPSQDVPSGDVSRRDQATVSIGGNAELLQHMLDTFGPSPDGSVERDLAAARTAEALPDEVAELIRPIEALLDLDEMKALSPHGIGGLARELFTRTITALSRLSAELAKMKASRDQLWDEIRPRAQMVSDQMDEIFRLGQELKRVERLLASQADEIRRKDEALGECIDVLALVERPAFVDPDYGEEVRRLGDRIGYGALMSSASASWREMLALRGYPVGGEYVAGPCHATVVTTLAKARAALAAAVPHMVPEGWKLVPLEPTEAMLVSGTKFTGFAAQTYRDMLAAAPSSRSAELTKAKG